jgi:hypothetical protein
MTTVSPAGGCVDLLQRRPGRSQFRGRSVLFLIGELTNMRIASLILLSLLACKKEETKPATSHDHDHAKVAHAKRRDPGPRRMTAVERDAERRAAAERLGPDPQIGTARVDEEGHNVVDLPDGTTYMASSPGHNVRKRPDVMSPVEFTLKRPDLYKAIGDSMDHAEHSHCAQALVERNNFAVVEDLHWSLALHVTAKDGTLTIDDVETLSDWPETVDQEARDCYVSMFRGHQIPWDKDESFTFEFPTCLRVHPKMREYLEEQKAKELQL